MRSRWAKEEAPPARDAQAGLLLMSLTWMGFLPDYQTLLLASQAHLYWYIFVRCYPKSVG